MKKLLLISALFLVVMYPSMVLAGNVYYNASATFYNESFKLRATGTANISYNATTNWTITMNFSGLMKNKGYVFNISAQDQLNVRYDIPVTSDKSGNVNKIITITDLDSIFPNDIPYSQHDKDEEWSGYTILRLLDLTGTSAGITLKGVEPTSATNPYLPAYPKATMVMRAREDGATTGLGSLTFF